MACLTKQNDSKQNFAHNSSPTNFRYEPRESMAENIKRKMIPMQ